jgi:hypothetical protein
MNRRTRLWACAALCFLSLAPGMAAGVAAPSAGLLWACRGPQALSTAQVRPDEPRRPSCYAGRETVAFGRLLVDYGIATLKYGLGIVLIFLGLIVMALGYVFMLLDVLFCWR